MSMIEHLRTELQKANFLPLIKDTTFEDAYEYFRDFSDESRPEYKIRISIDIGVIHPNNPEYKPDVTIKKIYENGQESETNSVYIVNIFDENFCDPSLWEFIIKNYLTVQNQ